MTETAATEWFIISTKPKQEFSAQRNLLTLDINVYLPIYAKQVKKNKEKVETFTPLFCGYLFAQFDIDRFYQKVRYTRGVKKILGHDCYLWTIANERIEDIRSRENNGVVKLSRKTDIFRKGDSIRIDEGDFDGWEGIFLEELPDHERAIIMLTNVQYTTKVILPKKYLIIDR
jgi:transcriptional antiterminator RfaH